jgi:hypothetical protein
MHRDDGAVEELVRTTLEQTPEDATHWSTRSMARKMGIFRQSVLGIWRAFRFAGSSQRELYFFPVISPDNVLVFCVDEKSQIQALER